MDFEEFKNWTFEQPKDSYLISTEWINGIKLQEYAPSVFQEIRNEN